MPTSDELMMLQDCRYETVLLAAMKYALTLEEGDVVEAVIGTLKPRIPYLADDTLARMLTAVEMYVLRGKQYDFGEAFIPEWTDVMERLSEERVKRFKAKREEDDEMEGSRNEGKRKSGAESADGETDQSAGHGGD